MNSWKVLSLFLGIFTLGAISETHRIFTSDAPDIVASRASMIPLSLIFTVALMFFTVKTWRKGANKKSSL